MDIDILKREAMEIYKTLIDLVKNAYKNTQLGSFLKYRSDVGNSQYWEIINLDDDPEPDVCVARSMNYCPSLKLTTRIPNIEMKRL